MKACFVTFEGGEGSGKSTQLRRLSALLTSHNTPHITTREPGGSEGADRIRELLVTGDASSWSPVTETLLFTAARSDHIEKVIRPALASEKHVLCDRFSDSTIVYQGVGKGLGEAYVASLQKIALPQTVADLTLIFDIDPVIGLKRACARANNETRFESLPLDFHQSVRQGFHDIALREPERCLIIDANGGEDTVSQRVQLALKERLGWSI